MLPPDVALAQSLDSFKSRLAKVAICLQTLMPASTNNTNLSNTDSYTNPYSNSMHHLVIVIYDGKWYVEIDSLEVIDNRIHTCRVTD